MLVVLSPLQISPTYRVKECVRIHAVCHELKLLGVEVEEGEDWLRIHPAKTLKVEQVKTYNDHLVAMAYSLIGLLSGSRIRRLTLNPVFVKPVVHPSKSRVIQVEL